MENKKAWFITGAGRGMGLDIAKAALAAGNSVVVGISIVANWLLNDVSIVCIIH